MKIESRGIIILFICILLIIISCDEDYFSGKVITQMPTYESDTTLIGGGIIDIDFGGRGVNYTIKEIGLLCSKDASILNFELSNDQRFINDSTLFFFTDQPKQGTFSCLLTELQSNTFYHIRAYIVIHCDYSNTKGIIYENILYGDIKSFITNSNATDTIPDIPINLDTPSEVTAKFVPWGGLSSHNEINWKMVQNAARYDVYRSSTGLNNTYTLYSSADFYTHFEDWAPLIGDNYYKIKAVSGKYESDFSEAAYCFSSLSIFEPCPPAITSITGNASVLTISWSYSTDVGCGSPDCYVVRKSNPVTGQADSIITTTDTRFTHTSVHPGLNRYWVIARNNYAEKASLFDISNEIPLEIPTQLNANISGKTVMLSWNIVPQATSYQVYYSTTSSTGTYYPDDIVTGNNWQKNYPYASGTFYFKVKAIWNPLYALPVGGVISDFSNSTSISF
jgi:hypothetical protein